MATVAELRGQDLLERMDEVIARKAPPAPAPHAGPGFFSNVLLEVDSIHPVWSARTASPVYASS